MHCSAPEMQFCAIGTAHNTVKFNADKLGLVPITITLLFLLTSLVSVHALQEIIPELANSEFPDEITLLSLATHTSGLPVIPANLLGFDEELLLTSPESIPVNNILQPYERYTEDDLIEFLSNYTTPPPPMNSGPEATEYSNLGAGLLGYALETVLGASYDQLLQVRCVTLASIFCRICCHDACVL